MHGFKDGKGNKGRKGKLLEVALSLPTTNCNCDYYNDCASHPSEHGSVMAVCLFLWGLELQLAHVVLRPNSGSVQAWGPSPRLLACLPVIKGQPGFSPPARLMKMPSCSEGCSVENRINRLSWKETSILRGRQGGEREGHRHGREGGHAHQTSVAE